MIGEGIVGDLKSVNTLEMSSSSTEIVFSKNIIIVVCRKKWLFESDDSKWIATINEQLEE